MNIFVLDLDPRTCARAHCDKHLVKMIVEYTQLLCTAHHVLGTTVDKKFLYLSTHENHPCSKWVRESPANYKWLLALMTELVEEYSRGFFGRNHRTALKIEILQTLPKYSPDAPQELTEFPLCMPEDFHVYNGFEPNPVLSYRAYYIGGKSHLLEYDRREFPEWVLDKSWYNKIFY